MVQDHLFLLLQLINYYNQISYRLRSSGGVMVKLLVCGALAATISEIGYLLLPSRDIAERSLKRHKSSNQPTNQAIDYM